MFFKDNCRFFTNQRIEFMLDLQPRKNRWDYQQHPKAHLVYVCSPPWKSIAPQHEKCFKAI